MTKISRIPQTMGGMFIFITCYQVPYLHVPCTCLIEQVGVPRLVVVSRYFGKDDVYEGVEIVREDFSHIIPTSRTSMHIS